MYLVVTEKPSVGRAIERALGRGVKVFSLRGHVLDVDLPEDYGWNRVDPIEIFNVNEFKTIVRDKKTYTALKKFFQENYGTLVLATDNDHEGELIAYEVLTIWQNIKGYHAPYVRMRFNSTDENELIRAFKNPERDLNWKWVYKAMLRRNFDLITGAAFTRYLTFLSRRLGIKFSRVVSFGSCQSPTLYFIVKREREIREFKSKTYWVLCALVDYKGFKFEVSSDKFEKEEDAVKVREKIEREAFGRIVNYEEAYETIRRPLPIYTDDLLVDLVSLTGESASKILSIAENLYAEGYISYPRTETNKYPSGFNFKKPLYAVLDSPIGVEVSSHISMSPDPRNGRKDDKAHPPIYPLRPYFGKGLERTVWEYVARRFVANAFAKDAKAVKQKVEVDIAGVKFTANGSAIIDEGFFKVFSYFRPKDRELPSVKVGEYVKVLDVKVKKVKTKPPSRYTEAELLREMERQGIGTDATRASFPKILLERGYSVKERKTFKPTTLGINLINALESVEPKLVTPDTRRFVEELMNKIERGEERYENAFKISKEVYKKLFEKLVRNESNVSKKLTEGLKL